jgi:hypothetical protein
MAHRQLDQPCLLGCVVTGHHFDQNVGSFRKERRTAPIIRIANSRAPTTRSWGTLFIPGGAEAAGVWPWM